MTEPDQPTTRAIVSEALDGLKRNLSELHSTKLGRTFRASRDFYCMFACMTSGCAFFPYAAPTFVRVIRNADDWPELPISATLGAVSGTLTGMASIIGQVIWYVALYDSHPETAALPVITNFVSGAYEAGRIVYHRARQRLLNRPNSSAGTLEARIASTPDTPQ